MPAPDPEVRAAAGTVLAWLAAADAPPRAPVDAVVGFGMFDLRLPVYCAGLYADGRARRILFTGGVGAGSGRLAGPEALAWREAARRSHPGIPDAAFLLEARSTNTAENIAFSAALLARQQPPLAFGRELRTIGVVASPSRLRRVVLTLRLRQPAVTAVRLLPAFSFAAEAALYAENGVDYLAHLAGELDRLVDYPRRGWIAAEPLPPAIVAARALLGPAP